MNSEGLTEVSESIFSVSQENNEVQEELMSQMQQEGFKFEPNEMFPKEIIENL